jgi:PAS domain S-box-containing protein
MAQDESPSGSTRLDRQPWDDDARFRAVVQQIVDHAIMMLDTEGRIRTWNVGAERIFGYPPEEALGMPFQRLFTAQARAERAPEGELERAAAEGRCEDERWQPRKDGTLFFASGSVVPIRSDDGGLSGYTKILRDGTAQRRLQDELAEAGERLRYAQEISRTGTFEWHLETNRETWTEGMYRLYQIPSGTVIATYADWLQRVHPDDRQRVEAAFAEGIAYHQPVVVDFRIAVPEGERWVSCRCQPRYDHGRPVALAGTQIDITERKRAQFALERANRDLNQFAYVASHDLQEPLRMVRSYLGLLKRGYGDKLEARAGEFIDLAIDGAERMQRMIASLLELATVESGGLAKATCEVRHAVAEALDNLGAAVDPVNATIVVGELPIVEADCGQLVRVFQNLIGNALKYRRDDVPPRVAVSAERGEREWILAVADNGMGIEHEHRERIFDLFHRLHSSAVIPGSGLGLSICRKIVELHHGRIWVEDNPGGGSVFKFTIPADSGPPDSGQPD